MATLLDMVKRALHEQRVNAVPWSDYRACPTCRQPAGRACVSMSSAIVDGQPDGVACLLEHAHVARRRRSGR